MTLRVIFAGTPEFARVALEAIDAAGFAIPLVLTQPDRPAGRGLHLLASPVKQFAQTKHLKVLQPHSLRVDGRYADEAHQALHMLRTTSHDVMVVAAYGLILPQAVLDIPRYGCINIHASLLPRWRGAAPIQRALEAGDSQTGITLMQMEAGLDTGPILAVKTLPILETDTSANLHDNLALLGAQMVVTALSQLANGQLLSALPQPEQGICYAEKIRKEEAQLDFSCDAEVLARRIRAFNPVPGMYIVIRGQRVKVWQGYACTTLNKTADVRPGMILQVNEQGVCVACREGVLCLTELQKAGGKRLSLSGFLQSMLLKVGEQLEISPSAPI